MGWLKPHPVRFTSGESGPLPIVLEVGCAPGPVRAGAENIYSTGIRSPDLPGRSESLYCYNITFLFTDLFLFVQH